MEIIVSYEFTIKRFNRQYDRFDRSQTRDRSYIKDISYDEKVIKNINLVLQIN